MRLGIMPAQQRKGNHEGLGLARPAVTISAKVCLIVAISPAQGTFTLLIVSCTPAVMQLESDPYLEPTGEEHQEERKSWG